MHKWASDGLKGGQERMLKQTSTSCTGQLLAIRMSGWSVECIGLPWNVTLITSHPSLSLCWWCRWHSVRPVADDVPWSIPQDSLLKQMEGENREEPINPGSLLTPLPWTPNYLVQLNLSHTGYPELTRPHRLVPLRRRVPRDNSS